jgi:hypothetical protein
MIELSKLDSDVLVGHNISGFDLDVLLHRAQVLSVIIFSVNSYIQHLVQYQVTNNILDSRELTPHYIQHLVQYQVTNNILDSRELTPH